MTDPTEKDIQSLIRLRLGRRSDVRLFRNISSMVFVGRVIARGNGTVTLASAHEVHAGLFVGSSDLIGWKTENLAVLTDEGKIVPRTVAVFTSIEVKTPKGRTSEEQDVWLNMVRQMGGIAGVARSPEEAERLLL